MSRFKDLFRRVRSEIQEVTVDEARAAKDAVFVDVREADEWSNGHVPGALFVPRGFLEQRIEEKDRRQVHEARRLLRRRHAKRVRGADAPRARLHERVVHGRRLRPVEGAGAPLRGPRTLSAEQKSRYSRHLLVPEVGEAGQAKLLDSKVLLVGAGGLGSPAGLYLAAAGVGTLGLVDSDVVDLTQPPAPGAPHDGLGGPPQDRVRRGDHHGPEPRRAGRPPRPAPRLVERDGRHRAL